MSFPDFESRTFVIFFCLLKMFVSFIKLTTCNTNTTCTLFKFIYIEWYIRTRLYAQHWGMLGTPFTRCIPHMSTVFQSFRIFSRYNLNRWLFFFVVSCSYLCVSVCKFRLMFARRRVDTMLILYVKSTAKRKFSYSFFIASIYI